MPDINNVLIAGNVSSEPSLRKTTSGIPVVNFFIASNRKYKDNSGVWRENICHVGIVAWHKLAENCVDVLKIGSSILIEGELQSKTWRTDDGSNKSIVEIRARRIQFLEHDAKRDVDEQTALEIDKDKQQGKTEIVENDKDGGKRTPVSDEQIIEPTEFDFGYQNLKI